MIIRPGADGPASINDRGAFAWRGDRWGGRDWRSPRSASGGRPSGVSSARSTRAKDGCGPSCGRARDQLFRRRPVLRADPGRDGPGRGPPGNPRSRRAGHEGRSLRQIRLRLPARAGAHEPRGEPGPAPDRRHRRGLRPRHRVRRARPDPLRDDPRAREAGTRGRCGRSASAASPCRSSGVRSRGRGSTSSSPTAAIISPTRAWRRPGPLRLRSWGRCDQRLAARDGPPDAGRASRVAPGPPALKAACRRGRLRREGADLATLALRFAVDTPIVATTLVGMPTVPRWIGTSMRPPDRSTVPSWSGSGRSWIPSRAPPGRAAGPRIRCDGGSPQ